MAVVSEKKLQMLQDPDEFGSYAAGLSLRIRHYLDRRCSVGELCRRSREYNRKLDMISVSASAASSRS